MKQLSTTISFETPASTRKRTGFFKGLTRRNLIYITLFAIACLPYLNTIGNGFVYDDIEQVLNNPFIVSTHYLKQIFTMPVWAFKTLTPDVSYIRPLMSLTYLGLHKIYGNVAPGYHLFSVFLSAWIVCLVYAVTQRWTRDEFLSIAAAIVFAFHPVHSEAVAWIGDVTDLEVTFFILLAFWCYLGTDKSPFDYWLRRSSTALFFALALLSKEIAVVLPPVITVFEHLYREDHLVTRFRTKFARYAQFWLVFAAYFVYRQLVLGKVVSFGARRTYDLGRTLAAGFQLFGHYVEKLFWPQNLIAFYVFAPPLHFWSPAVIFGAVAFIVLAIIALLFLRSRPVVSFAIVWLMAFLALALNVRWLAAAAFAERYLYLPSLGFAWIVAFCFAALWRRLPQEYSPKRTLVTAFVAILLILSFVRIYTRNRVWHDNATLYERTLQQQPNAVYIRVNLGGVYWSSNQEDRAIQQWEQAHKEAPKFVPPLINLAMASIFRRDWISAEQYLQKIFELSPKESGALLWQARMREEQGRNDEAEQLLLRAEESAPYDPGPYAELGELYFKQNRLAEAAKQLRVSAGQMNDPLYWDRLGNIYLQLGQLQEAEDAFHSALNANPYFSESNVGLAQVYERRGNAMAAQENYKKGLKDNPNNPVALAGLARLSHNKAP